MTEETTEPKTFTEEQVKQIVEFNREVERIRERMFAGMNLAIQRATAAGDPKESLGAMEWIFSNIELLTTQYKRVLIQQAQKPIQPPQQPPTSEPDAEETKE